MNISYDNYDNEELIQELLERGHYIKQTAKDLKLLGETKDMKKIAKKLISIEFDHTEAETYKEVKKEVIENIDFQIQHLQELNTEILKRKI